MANPNEGFRLVAVSQMRRSNDGRAQSRPLTAPEAGCPLHLPHRSRAWRFTSQTSNDSFCPRRLVDPDLSETPVVSSWSLRSGHLGRTDPLSRTRSSDSAGRVMQRRRLTYARRGAPRCSRSASSAPSWCCARPLLCRPPDCGARIRPARLSAKRRRPPGGRAAPRRLRYPCEVRRTVTGAASTPRP